MTFIAQYRGDCEHCGEEMKDTEVSYVPSEDKVLVHQGCLIPYLKGEDSPVSEVGRNEKMCTDCFAIHAGECG